MKRLSLPVDVGRDVLAFLGPLELGELVARFGAPHLESEDAYAYPGPVKIWAFETDDGVRFLLEFHSKEDFAALYSSGDLDGVMRSIGFPLSLVLRRGLGP